MSDNKYLELVGKLLRQAEGTDNEAEAELAMSKAQALATSHAIDLAVARAHIGQREVRETPTVKTIRIGERGKRGLATYVRLFLEIAEANDIKCNIAHNSTYVIAFGFESDIDMVETLYASLVIQMIRAAAAYLKTGEYKTERVWSQRRYEYVQVHGATARRNFQHAFALKVGQRLKEARAEAIQSAKDAEVVPADAPADYVSTGTELVLVAKAVEVADFYKAKSTARGSWGGERSNARTGRSASATNAGREAGARARLGGERAIGGGSRALTA